MTKPALLLLLGLLPLTAWGARPFVTDDARLTNSESCQLESWLRIYPDSHEVWALPACNPGGNLEFTLGGGRARHDRESPTRDFVLQAKTLFRPLSSHDWGWGLAAGVVRHPASNPGPNLFGNTYAYLPFSASFREDRIVMHANLGWLRERQSGRDNTTWGLGGEFKLTSRFLAIAETFGDNRNAPYWQLGGRFAIIPDLLQLDATVGQQFSGPPAGRWLSFGLRLTP